MVVKMGVALLTEGVDRNLLSYFKSKYFVKSPFSRRAWIEIPCPCTGSGGRGVALLTEGVDRNIFSICALSVRDASPFSRRAWIEIF